MMSNNVIVFGESGVGKSSIINLVVGSNVARTSSDANACTTRTQSYEAVIHGQNYTLWDTTGLDGGTLGLLRAAIAERNLKKSLRNILRKNEPSVLVYCVRGSRATRALVRHYQSIHSSIRESRVPMTIVVNGLENASGDMEQWWDRNAIELSRHGMEFVDHACITSINDDPRDPIPARARRTHSQDVLRDMIFRNCIPRVLNEDTTQGPGSTGGQGDAKGWTWVVWTYLVSSLLSG